MPATVHKLAISDKPVDINAANADELRLALPGVGNVLARRIVAYRDEHGPFAHPADLRLVPGISEKRISKFAPRLSVAPPNSGFRMHAVALSGAPMSSAPMPDQYVHPMPIYSIESEPLTSPIAPSMSSLMPDGPEESMGGRFRSNDFMSGRPTPPDGFMSGRPTPPDESFFGEMQQGGSLLAPPRPSLVATQDESTMSDEEDATDDAAEDAYLRIPLIRPMRVWVALGVIGLLSAAFGATFGIRSQDGGPRGRVDQRIGRVEGDVADLSGSVKALEGQATAFASSINALDARITDPTHKQPLAPTRAVEPPPLVAPAPVDEGSAAQDPRATAVRRRVRQAMRELDSFVPSPTRIQ